jgi:hypothetical protein
MRLGFCVVLVALLAPSHAAATMCLSPAQYCYCQEPARYGIVVTESLDGARSLVRVERAGLGLAVDQRLELPRTPSESIDSRWMLTDTVRRAVDARGMVPCSDLPNGYPSIDEETLFTALANPLTCERTVQSAGVVLRGCGGIPCSATPMTLAPLLALLPLLRRRRPNNFFRRCGHPA